METGFYGITKKFSAQKPSSWPYMEEINKILTNVGLDHAILKHNEALPDVYYRLSLEVLNQKFVYEINTMSTLSLYKFLKGSTKKEKYPFNIEYFEGARLKFKARTGCLGLQADLM